MNYSTLGRRGTVFAHSLTAAALLLAPQSAQAVIRTWQGATAAINTATNWSTNTVPTTGDQALFNGSGPNSPTFNLTWGTGGLGTTGGVVGMQFTSGQSSAFQMTNVGAAGLVVRIAPAGTVTPIQIDSGAGAVTFGDGAGGGATFAMATGGNGIATLINNSANTATLASDVTLSPGGGGSTAWIFDGTGNWQIDGAIVNAGTSVDRNGGGTLILSRAAGNAYTGGTTVTDGTLLANNTSSSATGSSTVTVASDGRLGGTGIIDPTGAAAISISGTLAPGNSTAAANAISGSLGIGGTLALLDGSTFAVELGGTGIGDGVGVYDQVNQTETGANGSIALTGAVTLTASLINGFAPTSSDVFYILNSGNIRTGFFDGIAEGGFISLGGGYTGQVTYTANYNTATNTGTFSGGNDVAIYNIVPEPGTFAMLLFGGAFLWFFGKKRS